MSLLIIPALLDAQQPIKPADKTVMQNMPVLRADQAGLMEEELDTNDFAFFSEQFADFRILRYQVPGFELLTPQQKELCYYLYQAALSGRDIFWDQNYKYNLLVRKTLEAILASRSVDRKSEDFRKFQEYAKRVMFSNGIHHVYSNHKMLPEFSRTWFTAQLKACKPETLPLLPNQSLDDFIRFITPILFDPTVAAKRVNKDAGADVVATSAVNFYENVTQEEASSYYKNLYSRAAAQPPSYGLNSKLVKENGRIVEKVWRIGGMYGPAIERIVYWLEQAERVAENDNQRRVIRLLMEYYRSGDLRKFDEYAIAWLQDTTSMVDFVNGFIEVYHDPLGFKGSWEAYVSIKDLEASRRIKTISDHAAWFEQHSPIMDEHKKKDVKGISAKVINVVVEAGDLAPLTAIGINLPNAEWIREQHGSKSVTLGNITYAYSQDGQHSGVLEEFYADGHVIERLKTCGALAENLHTDLHEVLGHASGQINKGVGTFHETLKSYASTLEEARADLVALYYILDPKLVEIGVMPSLEYGKAAYDRYITNGLMVQLSRLGEKETQLEQAHMRCRQLIASWAFEQGQAEQVISRKVVNGKTFFVVNDYQKLRALFGRLLREVQRIKSEGDYEAGSRLVETYGVKIDKTLHREVLARYSKLGIAPYRGFIQPRLDPIRNDKGQIIDVKISYPKEFLPQMLYYGREYSFLPVIND
ncbi:MAG: hypothetical protein RMK52_03890 [Chitinophagales bacterium]|nr:dipeptidyl peptidase 3 [Chitinophagales bacterium]MDW8393369.1 hypothetical protein [Chitinophagales bacterium]